MGRIAFLSGTFALLLALGACSSDKAAPEKDAEARAEPIPRDGRSSYKVGNAYTISGRFYRPSERFSHVETGRASWYGPGFHGKPTANGEIFDSTALTAAHRTLQLPSIVRVTNLGNGVSATLRVNDRGPYHGDRILDVSEAAAEALGFKSTGVALVRVELLEEPSREVARLAKSGATVEEVDRVRARADSDRTVLASTVPPRPPAEPRPVVTTPPQPRPAPPTTTRREPQPAPVVAAPQPKPQAAPVAQPGSVSPPPSAPSRPPPRREAPATDLAFVQVGAFGDASNVKRLETRLASVGAVNVDPIEVQGRTLHRVRVGPFESEARARSALSEVVGLGLADARLVYIR